MCRIVSAAESTESLASAASPLNEPGRLEDDRLLGDLLSAHFADGIPLTDRLEFKVLEHRSKVRFSTTLRPTRSLAERTHSIRMA